MWIKHFKGELTKKEWKCNPFVFINIGPDGNVRSCGAAFGNIGGLTLEACLKTKEADQARRTMKNCLKPCLQTCWANPQADSLTGIIDALIHDLKKNKASRKEKKELLTAALTRLSAYEELLKNVEP
jgi:hypothetical protein